jgi:dephospho-CoA kinase
VTGLQRRWLLGGGIGTGKSTVRRILEDSGVWTIDADSVGHSVLEPDGPAFDAVASRWPTTVVQGRIDRRSLGSIVFAEPTELSALESMTHPHIFGTIEAMLEEVSDVAVVEIPLLDTSPPGDWGRIVVDCDDESRLQRLIARGMTADDARARMSIQPSRSRWLAVADLVVPNHGTLDDLETTVSRLVPALA